MPALAALFASPARGPGAVVVGAVLLALAVFTAVLLVRFAVVDSVVVLEGGTAMTAWRRAAAITAGQRWASSGRSSCCSSWCSALAMSASQLVRVVPELNHFVVRVLLDCAVAVSQSLFTIALFLFYWRGRGAEGRADREAAGVLSAR